MISPVTQKEKDYWLQPNSPLCVTTRESIGAVPAIITDLGRLRIADDLPISKVCTTCPVMIIAI